MDSDIMKSVSRSVDDVFGIVASCEIEKNPRSQLRVYHVSKINFWNATDLGLPGHE